jgi:D-3-phosphoglycerate dehydrogenase / 2-oxoglutarate reductase
VEVNGYVVDLEPAGHLVFVTYEDRPGMVGAVGSILGDANINIAGMQVSRETRGGLALVALRLDSALPPEVLDKIATHMDAKLARSIDL